MAGTAASAEPHPVNITLADAVYLGIRNNYDVRSAYIERIAEKFDLKVAEDKFTPQLVLNSTYSRQRAGGVVSTSGAFAPTITWNTPTGGQIALTGGVGISSTVGDPKGSYANWTLTALQPLLQGGGTEVASASIRIAEIGERSNKLALKSTVENTVTNIIMAYRQLLLARGQLDIAKKALDRAKELVEINRSLIAAGRMAAVDIVQTQADVANQELSVSQSADSLETARLQLLTLLALDQRSPVTPVDHVDTQELTANLDHLLDVAFNNQESYLQALLNVEIDKINLMVARNNRLWSLNVVAAASQGPDFPLPLPRQPNASAGLQLSIPLNDLTKPQGEVDAKVALDHDELGVQQLHDQIEQSVRNDAREVETQWRQLGLAIRACDLAQQQLDIARQKLEVGRSSNFETVSYENQLEAAQMNELGAKIAYLNALTTLDQQVGTTLDTWQIQLNDAP